MNRITTWIFLLIIFMPITLRPIKNLAGIKVDVSLNGYSASVEKPEFSAGTFLNGSFQRSYGAWTEQTMPFRGVFTKTYNTIRYQAFRLGSRPIGNNGSIFEEAYLNAELAIGAYNYSIPESADKLQNMVDHMNSVSAKLNQIGKYLYVYIAPSKADVYPEDMPDEYVALAEPGAVNLTDLFKEKISGTAVPYFICADMAGELEYPAFYPTGIHWSRTYEQLASQKVISDLSALSGKPYRNIRITGEAVSSKIPFWRDTDVYDLLNVWTYPDIDYYQYPVESKEEEFAAAFSMLLVGDSFAEGLVTDIREHLPEDACYFINRLPPDGWDNFDWRLFLDLCDFIVIEMTEPELIHYTNGFIDYLDSYLDSYVPNKGGY